MSAEQPRTAERLRALHRSGPVLVLANAWDADSARTVEEAGGPAVATASAAIAHSHGYEDGEHMPVDLAIAAIAEVADAVTVPVTADLESGYGDPFSTVRRAVAAGAVGANIEDALRPLDASVELMEQALEGAAAEGIDLVLNARTDVYLLEGIEPERRLDEAVRRGQAFLAAGAECVFVPMAPADAVAGLVSGLGERRVSLLGRLDGPHPQTWLEHGVSRVSYGPYLYRLPAHERPAALARLLGASA